MLSSLLVQVSCLIFAFYRLFSYSRANTGIFYFALLITAVFGSLVPLDVFFGLDIRYSAFFPSIGLNDYSIVTAQLFAFQSILFLAIILLIEFSSSNSTDKPEKLIHKITLKRSRPVSNTNLRNLSIFVIFITIVLCLADFSLISSSISNLSSDLSYKHARIEARSSSLVLLLLSYFYNFTSTFITVSLFYAQKPFDGLSKSLLLSVFVVSLYFSQGSNIAIFLIVYALRFSSVFFSSLAASFKVLFTTIGFLLIIPLLKISANVIWLGLDNTNFINFANAFDFFGFYFSYLSFSKIESLSAFEVTAYFVEGGKMLPLENFLPYINSLSAFNPFSEFQSYASTYADFIRSGDPGKFSFSPIAEACIELGSCHFAPFISSLILALIILFSCFSRNIWVRLVTIQFIIRYHRLDLYSAMRRYFYVEFVFIIISLFVISILLKLKSRSFRLS